jgi:hypothetical protein
MLSNQLQFVSFAAIGLRKLESSVGSERPPVDAGTGNLGCYRLMRKTSDSSVAAASTERGLQPVAPR